MNRCSSHGIEYDGYSCPRCASEKQHRELMEVQTKRDNDQKEREDRRRRDELRRERESWEKDKEAKADREREASEAWDRQRSLDGAASDAAATLREAKKQTRIIMEQSYSEDYVYQEGLSGKYAKYTLRADGTTDITFEEAYISGRVVAFNKGCEEHKKQFSDPGIEYIDTQIKDMASKLGLNYDKSDCPFWKSDEHETTIYYYQNGKIFSLKLGFPKLSFGVVRMEIPQSRYLSLKAILEAEPQLVDKDQSLCFLDISFTDGKISINQLELEEKKLFKNNPRLIDVFAEGFSGVLSRFNQDAAKKKRKEVMNQLYTKLKDEKEREHKKEQQYQEKQREELAQKVAAKIKAEKLQHDKKESMKTKRVFIFIVSCFVFYYVNVWLVNLVWDGEPVAYLISFLPAYGVSSGIYFWLDSFT